MNNRALIFKMIIFYDMSRSFYWYQDICNLVTFVIFGIGCFWKHLFQKHILLHQPHPKINFCFSTMGHFVWTLQRSWSWRRTTWAWGIPWSVRSVGRRTWQLPSCPAVTWYAVWTVPPPWGNAPPVERSSRAPSKPTLLNVKVSLH